MNKKLTNILLDDKSNALYALISPRILLRNPDPNLTSCLNIFASFQVYKLDRSMSKTRGSSYVLVPYTASKLKTLT